MKKAFSFVEVIIAVVILSFVMITLLQTKNNNIFLLSKSDEKVKLVDYILLAINLNDYSYNKNESFFLDKLVDFKDDEIRKELKEIKVNIKDKELKDIYIEQDNIKLKFKTYVRTYEIENMIKKSIYTFEVKF